MKHGMKKVVSLLLAATMMLSLSAFAFAEDAKWTEETTKDGWIKVTQEGGPTLGYSPDSGVTILTVDGFAFKDLDKDGELDIYEDWREDAQTRAEDLASQLDKDFMIAMMSVTWNSAASSDLGDEAKAELDLGKRSGLAPFGGGTADSAVDANNVTQAYVEAKPFGVVYEMNAEPGSLISSWPSNLSVATTFDPSVAAEEAYYSSIEYRAVGVSTINGPQIGIATEPRWSRIQDSFGEDPQLSSDMAAAYVNALQSSYDAEGNDLGWGKDSVVAITKHFPGDGAAEGGREAHNAFGAYNVYPGDNFYTHVLPFAATMNLEGKTGQTAGIMPKYSISVDENGDAIDGDRVGAGYSEYIIEELLRDELGFDGYVLSDFQIAGNTFWGVEDLTMAERYCKILEAGVDRTGGDGNLTDLKAGAELYEEKYGEEALMERLRFSTINSTRFLFQERQHEPVFGQLRRVRVYAGTY